MPDESTSAAESFAWEPQPKAWSLVLDRVEQACRANPFIQSLRERMLAQTGTRLVDWLDHVCVGSDELSDSELNRVGYRRCDERQAWIHEKGLFPQIVRPDPPRGFPVEGLAIKADAVEDFLDAHELTDEVEVIGPSFSDLRCAIASRHLTHRLIVVERHGNASWTPANVTAEQVEAVHDAIEWFAARPRSLVDHAHGFDVARRAFDATASSLGQAWACDLFFLTERNYWQSRNHAAQVQRDRQASLGLGWANHDHHTYRSSREHFASLIGLLEHMGFECRERFYAGAQAGWGAQVLEHPVCGFVVFADVDLSADEVAGDFSHDGLAARKEFGTVGMWCKLHGEAALHAGLHHLECQFDFDAARRQLADAGIDTMEPFTDFSFLRQAFTVGQQWSIQREHLERLVDDQFLSQEQADRFATNGALGSHLEILERNDGYKGFNQTGVSEIIARTDPRDIG